ncbi:glycosyltransferase family 2 protein [Mucilaginibacter sp. SJ]|uniref:glycosyltransferase family 2 protein n=1 Tax=Mucilaginibacter sp. SJ TaxID=3029053 RepID=UPI0023A98ECB|nr:glycosyltransferase family 2 protein [Mucilaginibacter sp. SJ]WDZ99916.1 glycosyltransferase family 2 protein [Mucilaginibacter sp. SJ]
MTNIAILIPVHNRINITKRGFKHLYDAIEYYKNSVTGFDINVKVVLIDDGSTDGTSEWVSENYGDTLIVKGDGNLWWSGAINAGIMASKEKLPTLTGVLLWNDDVIPAQDYIYQLVKIVNEHKEDLFIGSMVMEKDQEHIVSNYGGSFNHITGKRRYKNKGELLTNITTERSKVDWLPGMGTYISANLLDKIGMFDDKVFPQYFGDTDYCLRAGKIKQDIYVYRSLKIFNDIATTGIYRPKNREELFKAFTSIRSKYHLKKNFLFAYKHGFFPFTLVAFFRNYFFLMRAYLKK